MMNELTTPEAIQEATKMAMQNAYAALQKQFEKFRTGRANPALLENIRIEQANVGVMPLQHISTITAADALTLLITPWDKTLVPTIEKAILKAGLGLNPAVTSDNIRVSFPPLSEQRRKDSVRRLHEEAEAIRNEIRNHRRDANKRCKELLKQKLVNEDQDRRFHADTQKVTDNFIERINQLVAEKEHQIMQV